MATPNKSVNSGTPVTSHSVTARTGTLGTVHHLAQGGTVRTTVTPFANLQQGILAMSMQSQKSTSSHGNVTIPKYGSTISSISTKLVTGPSPRKKIKIEEVAPANKDIAAARQKILEEKIYQMKEVKENYIDHLTECFFLQNGGQLMDYFLWRKKPTPQLVEFLKSGKLDSDDEDENPLQYLEKKNEETKVLTSSVPSVTPVATSTTLPASVVALSHQGPSLTSSLLSTSGTGGSNLHKSMSDSKLVSLAQSTKVVMSTQSSGALKKSPPASPGRHRQGSSDGTNIKGISSQEAIVERAKQEAQVMSRVAELRKEGLWSSRRLPKVQEPPRTKAHWDYLLEEMQWLAADFQQERKWKKTAARKLAKMVKKHFQELEQKELRAEKEESMKLKRIAGQLAKMVKEFWSNIEKVVEYKQNSRLDEKRKKAMDLHLNFIVDQTEKYSSWLTEGLAQSSKGSSAGSLNTTPDPSVAGDDEFKPEGGDTDDEETIEKDEEDIDEAETKDEIEALQKESELPIEKLIESLPKEILEKPAEIKAEEETPTKKKDDEFEVDEDDSDEDVEDSIAEQEKVERPDDVKKEIDDLKDEGEMSIEELRAKYAAAYDSDFEMPRDSGDESTDIADSDDDNQDVDEDEEATTEGGEEEEEEEEEEVDIEGGDDAGLEMLMETEEKSKEKKEEKEKELKEEEVKEDKDRELTDIAAEAARLQPKGYTLQTTDVKVKVPFLLKHTLREYQHVGLDWLATMYEKRLNGILADEMGLGKTIQTIALLAHLACEKGIWGPHLIVVPTSVMLNWEMEVKKWCPSFKILTYYGSQKERKQKRMGWTKTNAFHICITSYKLVIQDHQAFRRKKWKYLILDEAQNIKNFKSQRWQCLLNFNSYRRLLLTGTPLQNSLMELWSLMHFLMPHVFQSHRDFKEWFANPLTGMIEGSHEYNESLIRRLHKVLRPFLLRRLKDDVEKQMPKKYEHIVMCHLSKRQRFLYDEFMAQGKTKETLASGHFMSVINILMQLRKVCNHPSLFDPRPIVSPFQMEGIVYHTASLVKKVMDYNPLENIELHRYPGLAEMERDLPAFIAHRVRKLQTSRRLIEEIDTEKAPPSRPPAGKLKANSIRCISPAVQTGRASPAVVSRSVSPSPVIKATIPSITVTSAAGTTPPLQATVSQQTSTTTVTSTAVSTSSQHTPVSSQPITVQIQHTDQGTRLVVPQGQLSQLPGFIQIVQTSSGQHLIATSTPVSTVTSTSTLVNGTPVVTVASSSSKTEVSSSVSQVKMSPVVQSGTSPTVQLPTSTSISTQQKPVMRVSPLPDTQSGTGKPGTGVVCTAVTTSTTSCVMSTSTKPVSAVGPSPQYLKHVADQKRRMQRKEFFLETLYEKEVSCQKEKLNHIARMNKLHCDLKPVYGQDLCDAINIFRDPYSGRAYRSRDSSKWNGPGHIHCSCVKLCKNPCHPKYLWNQTRVLSDVIHTPEQYLEELKDILERFVFLTPPVHTPQIKMHLSHPPPSYTIDETYRDHLIRSQVSPKAKNYHKICTNMTVQFPELRLIQYDCGKLQTLDILLRRLKSGDHRVLIFTQMTRMLDILEAFLNYHGYRYLRLDGTTKVEQRQQLMDRFNADRRIFVFILSTRSGGIGVNLTGADTVIFYDSDWNPTMDAQAQDRCHRIGQTRDVHIYRLVSERTVEENILKKANQKRMLGDMAIEGGNFTTAFFKQNTIEELFTEPSGLDSLVKEKEEEEKRKEEKRLQEKKKKSDPTETAALAQFEKALAKTEDETDAVAIDVVKAEQKAELAEFDENIPWDEREAEQREEESHVEQELAMLEKELTPIERYAVAFAELQMEPVNAEELELAEEDIENVKKDWELSRLKALKEEEERRAELEEDEMLYTYSRDDAYQQVKKRNKQLAMEFKKAAEAKAAAGSPRKKANNMGELEESPKKPWVYKTPKIIRDLSKNRAVSLEDKSLKKSRSKTKIKNDDDTGEEVDVETVTGVDLLAEVAVKKVRKKLLQKKTPKQEGNKQEGNKVIKRPRKPKNEASPAKVHARITITSTETTKLDSLPGFSIAQSQTSPNKSEREGIFEQIWSPSKSSQDRANIFEQFGLQNPLGSVSVPQSPHINILQPSLGINVLQTPTINVPQVIAENQLPENALRLINTSQGRQMVVVSSGQPALQQSPQNVVLVQGMQGLPRGLVLGSNMVSLQGTPINIATLTRPAAPLNVQGARLAGPAPILNQPRITAARIVGPASQSNQNIVQRLVTAVSANSNLPSLPGLGASQISTVPVQGNIVNFQSLNIPQQIGKPVTAGQGTSVSNSSPLPSQTATTKRSSGQTIASLIAASKSTKQTPTPPKSVAQPNLANIMKAQIPVTASSPSVTQVKVNPAVAKLVASHIQAAAAASHPTSSQSQPVKVSNLGSVARPNTPAIINLTSRSQSPSIVKLVSSAKASTAQTKKPQITTVRGDSPIATINIKGLPPGVSIPVSLVNSLVSGSIGGMSKSNVNVIKGVVPTVSKPSPKLPARIPADVNVNNGSPVSSPKPQVNPSSGTSSPTLQAWSNPNLVIRTRRASLQQKQGSSPQPVKGTENISVQLPTPALSINVTNNNSVAPSVTHSDQVVIAKKIEQEEKSDPKSNGIIECIEIN